MLINLISLDERLKKITKEAARKTMFQLKTQEIIDLIRFSNWVKKTEGPTLTFHVYEKANILSMHISALPAEEAIENILGPIYRKLNIAWELTFCESDISKEDPVFLFTLKSSKNFFNIDINIYVKEGSFKTCRFEKIKIPVTKSIVKFEHVEDFDTEIKMICT